MCSPGCRSLALTEDGDRFLASVVDGVESIQAAIADETTQSSKPAGVLKVSVALTFDLDHILPFLPVFMERYPDVQIDWSFENRQVGLIGEGFDAAIGGGMELAPGVVAQRLAPPRRPPELAMFDGISMRSALTGRVRIWQMRNREGDEAMLEHKARIVASDPEAICRAALMGLGVAMIAVPYVAASGKRGAASLLPDWYADLGAISLYFAGRKLLPAKTRAFIDHISAAFRERNLAQRFSAEG